MSLWTITLIIAYLGVIVLNLIFSFTVSTALNILLCAAIIMLPSIIILGIGKIMPKGYFNEERRPFAIGRVKKSICNFTKVKRWKDKVIVAGRVLGQISNPHDIKFLDTFIFESCFAEWLHKALCYWSVIGCIIVTLINKALFWPIALPFALIFIYQNMSSVLIQWFMRPRMVRYRELLIERQQRQQEDDVVSEQVRV